MAKDFSYAPLMTAQDSSSKGEYVEEKPLFLQEQQGIAKSRRLSLRGILITFTFVLPWLLNFILVTGIVHLYSRRGPSNPIFPQNLYSPAQSALIYETKKFTTGFPGTSPYAGPPSAALDTKWRDLYEFTLAIPASEASHLPNKTIPLTSAPDSDYAVGLSVFHDLHCLDSIRKALNIVYFDHTNTDEKEFYNEDSHTGSKHIMHCVDQLRQSAMCHGDISPIVWQWDRKAEEVKVFAQTAHTCRNFEAIWEWGRSRVWEGPITSDEGGRRPSELGACGYTDEGCGN